MDLFASKLRDRAAQLGISNAEAARRSGLSERRYAHYVSGLREPDLSTLVRIARSLGTTPDSLLGVSDEPVLDAQQAMVDRIRTAAGTLPEDVLDSIAIQIEALAAAKGRR
jgi:transcriptional regulator with XRE-family HTH domain